MKRSTIVMVLIFIILGVVVFIVEKPHKNEEKVKAPELGALYPDFKTDEITKMEFGSFGGSTILVKENEKWLVEDGGKRFPADAEAAAKALETVSTLNARELISTNPAKHITFQVNSPQETETTDQESGAKQPFKMGTLGTEVILKDKENAEKAHFFVGKNGAADFMSTYVRKNGTDSVVIVDGYLKAIFGKGSAANWKDRTLCKVDKTRLNKIILGEGKSQIVLESYQDQPAPATSPDATPAPGVQAIDKKWRMTAPETMEIDKKHSDRLVNTFTNFLATDYAPDLENPADYGFEKPSAQAVIVLDDGIEMKFLFGNEAKDKTGQFYVKKDGDERIFIIPKYRLETIQRKVQDFKEDPNKPAAPPPQKPPVAPKIGK